MQNLLWLIPVAPLAGALLWLGWRSVNFGTAAYSQVSSILNPRVLRLGVQFKF